MLFMGKLRVEELSTVSDLIVRRLNSLAELRGAARAWDDLWLRSEIALPTARAELLALWYQHFAAEKPFQAFVVEHQGQLVAALPLVEGRRWGLKVSALPQNQWSPAGDLLLDPDADCDRVCELLINALQRDAEGLAWFDAIPGDTLRWQEFRAALDRQQLPYVHRERFRINQVRIEGDWQAYFDARSRNHRRHIRKSLSHARRAGDTDLIVYDALAPNDVEPLLRSCLEIESLGWKGRADGAALNVPGVWSFYLEQAKQLAAWGQLSLAVLQHEGRPIAFEYGWRGKNIYFSPKVGYDESFAQFSPGQLLRSFLFERAHDERSFEWVDFLGPASDATSKWATHDYPIDSLVVALRGSINRAVVAAYRHGWPWLQGFRNLAHRRNRQDLSRSNGTGHHKVEPQPPEPAVVR